MPERVKEVAVEEAERLKTLTSDAARSGAYLYPIRVSLVLDLYEDQCIQSHADSCTPVRVSHTSYPIGRYGNL